MSLLNINVILWVFVISALNVGGSAARADRGIHISETRIAKDKTSDIKYRSVLFITFVLSGIFFGTYLYIMLNLILFYLLSPASGDRGTLIDLIKPVEMEAACKSQDQRMYFTTTNYTTIKTRKTYII
jgi:hypothetical protein